MFKQCWKVVEALQSCPNYQVGSLEDGESFQATVKYLKSGKHISSKVTEDDPEKLIEGLKLNSQGGASND